MRLISFLRDWMLPIAMVVGAVAYLVYSHIGAFDPVRPYVNEAVSYIQPLLIFMMLFLSFCRVKISDLRPCRWQAWLLLIQVLSFSLLAVATMLIPKNADYRVLIEGAMLCLICPTATSAAVVVSKLNGSAANVITYTILINLMVAVIIPLIVPLVHPQAGVSFITAFLLIIGKVFPLLLCPLIAALLVRYLLPKVHAALLKYPDLPFYLWAIALALAIAMTVKTIVHTHLAFGYQAGLAVISLVCCFLQFYLGRKIGGNYDDSVTAGQALGQKNTILAIWMGYTFFTPITAIAGGFYSVWHNLANSYQLYKHKNDVNAGK